MIISTLGWTLSLSNISTPGVFKYIMIHFGLRLIMVASLSLIPMEIKFREPIFFRNYKRICFKKWRNIFTGINNPSISTQMLIKKIIMDGFKLI
jgi:hypothetical protein